MLTLPNLTELNAEAVNDRLEALAEIVKSLDVGIETGRGQFRDLVLRMHAVLIQADSEAIRKILVSSIPGLAETNIQEVDPVLLNEVAASYGLEPVQASSSFGQLTLILSSQSSVFIPAGSIFTTNEGLAFTNSSPFALRQNISSDLVTDQRVLTPTADGNFQAVIEVSSVDPGVTANIKAGTQLTPNSLFIANLVEVFATQDFSGGASAETLVSLARRIRRFRPGQTMSTRQGVVSYVTAPSNFPDLKAISVIGAGDPELRRDKADFFPGGTSVDIYVRPNALTTKRSFVVQASVTSTLPGLEANWLLAINRDLFPGFYRVVSIRHADGVLNVKDSEVNYGVDNTPIPNEMVPKFLNSDPYGFHRFRTAGVIFKTQYNGLQVGDTASFEVVLEGSSDIARIQTLASLRNFRNVGGDTLVLAAIPCVTAVSLQLHIDNSGELPSTSGLQADVANYINSLGFSGSVYASEILSVAQNQLPPGVRVASLELVGNVIYPDGRILRIRDSQQLTPKVDLSQGVTNRTVCFFCLPEDVRPVFYDNVQLTV
jgi:hypothetical protein